MRERPIKALLIEDNPDDLLIFNKIIHNIKNKELSIKTAERLSDAIALLKAETFDLIITDLALPDSQDLDTVRGLKPYAARTPIILLTGLDDTDVAVQAMREGAQDYLIKGEITTGALLRAAIYAIERNSFVEEREKLIRELTEALAKVKTLSGLLPICASCKKIRNDKGYWEQVEMYLKQHADIEFTHGFCPECIQKLYPEFSKERPPKKQ